MKKVCIVVLGDIGRSPRMRYHSLSLADCNYNVNIIGYKETKISNALTQHSNIHIHPLVPCPTITCSKLLNYILKTIWQIFTLFCALLFKRADYVLVQNPPAVPTLFTCWLYCFIMRASFIIDWHNYGYTIMALSIHKDHLFVTLTKWMESFFGRKADGNFCVTESMRKDLKDNWDIDAITLYDRPSEIFRPISLKEKHSFLLSLSETYSIFSGSDSSNTIVTEIDAEGNVQLLEKRPGIMISSTSWTEDEDFSVLLSALLNYENSCLNGNPRNLPKLICIITGKGPLKDYYGKLIEEQKMQFVTVLTPWLEPSDYPLLLASADLGVCLHTSSSGLDLPMKVVDMFGSGVPVCAYNYNCLHELVKHEENGFVFKNSDELTDQILNWFDNFPNNEQQRAKQIKFTQELEKFQQLRWCKNWEMFAYPLFK